MRLLVQFFAIILVMSLSYPVFAASGGWELGFNFGLVNAEQKDMDSIIEQDATGSASSLGNGLEFDGHFGYNFGDVGLFIRPGYFWVSEDGGGSEYSVNAITIMPILRWSLLSNNTINFYSQLGMGWVNMFGEMKQASGTIEFSGSNIGYSAGLGSEFCFFGSHCFYLEANLRIASVDRMSVDKANGTISGISQGSKGQELEISNRDFGTSLSGIHGVVGYNYHF